MELEMLMPEMQQGQKSRIRQADTHTSIYLVEDIDTPDQYTDELELLNSASPDEIIFIHLNSNGGVLDTALQFINSIQGSAAKVVAKMSGANCSASTMIMLACDEWVVDEWTFTMLHTPSGGFVGRFSDVHGQSDFFKCFIRNFYESTYAGFLFPDEIEGLLNGKDFWMDSKELSARLERRRSVVEERKQDMLIEHLIEAKEGLEAQLEGVEEELERLINL